jgi:chaperonin GroES
MKLATQVVEEKNEPFDGASNIKFPTVAMASVQFAARAMPQVVKDKEVVKCTVNGKDPGGQKAGRAKRVGTHMSYQLLDEMHGWEDDMDSLLTALPIEGVAFKKTYYNPALRQNVSEWVRPSDLVVNFNYKNLEVAPRVTQIVRLLPNIVIERVRSGAFRDYPDIHSQQHREEEDSKFQSTDDDRPITFYEQHRYLDLDGDGYGEPYIVTVHRDSQKVVRILPRWDAKGQHIQQPSEEEVAQAQQMGQQAKPKVIRIDPVHYYTAFIFMPCPRGSVYGMGYGRLLGPLNASINMTLNQIHDAGTLSNTQGGFVGKSFQMGRGRQAGNLSFRMGEFVSVMYSGDDIRKSIMPLPFKGPDATLFQALQLLIGTGEKLGSVTDPMIGESPGTNVPATTTLALIEQGSKVFSSVFKRIHRSLKSEFRKIYRLNRLFLDEQVYFTVLDEEEAVAREDYDDESFDVGPVSDPNMISDTQMLVKAELLKEFLGQGLDDFGIMARILEAARVPDWEELIPKEEKKPEPDPKTILEMQRLEIERDRLDMQMFETQFKVLKLQADAMKSFAAAEAAELGPQIEVYKKQMDLMMKQAEAKLKQREGRNDTGSKSGGSK